MLIKEEIQDPAIAVIEAIETLTERQERECPECKGKGWKKEKMMITSDCPVCNGSCRVKGKWEWEPRVRERILITLPSGHQFLSHISSLYDNEIWIVGPCDYPPPPAIIIEKEHITPLLHWERIQEIMLSLGYKLYLRNPMEGATVAFVKSKEIEHEADVIEMLQVADHIPSDKWYHASSFQSAVMQAVAGLVGG